MKLLVITLLMTFYCPCKICCGKWAGYNHHTATGTYPTQKFTLACDPRWTSRGDESKRKRFIIPGYGLTVCEDTGSKVKGTHVDMFVESHEEAVRLSGPKGHVLVKAYEVKLNDAIKSSKTTKKLG